MARISTPTNMRDFSIVILGQGAAGLSAALAAAERAQALDCSVHITIIDRAGAASAGGGTRFSPSNMRLGSRDLMAADFAAMIEANSNYDRPYFDKLGKEALPTIDWLKGHGIIFEEVPYYLAATPRYRPIGGGAALVKGLAAAAAAADVTFLYDFVASDISRNREGRITALAGRSSNGDPREIAADAIILACGGFEGNPEALRRYFGPGGECLRPISPGTAWNTGAGIDMAARLGALMAGDWSGMHCEPIDPRANNPAAVVLVYPYGIVVDQTGQRFFDEGAGLVHETWESLAKRIHFTVPGRIAFAIFDAALLEIPDYRRAIRSEVEPVSAMSVAELAQILAIPPDQLIATVDRFNRHVPKEASPFDASCRDGRATAPGLDVPKSNWALRLETPPFLAFPLICGIAYTFGGLATNEAAEVLGADGPIPDLYAAGEITGHFFGTAPNAIAVLRALVFGRIAGNGCVEALGAGSMGAHARGVASPSCLG